jgi:hypothetical protein
MVGTGASSKKCAPECSRHGLMSALGQKRKCARSRGMSVRPPGPDIVRLHAQVRFVPFAIFFAPQNTAHYSVVRSMTAPRPLFGSNRRAIVRFGDQHIGGHRSWT